MTSTSLSILERAKSQDSQAWRDLEQIYAPLLRKWMLRYDVADGDADDLVQEVLLFVAERLPEFQHSGRAGAFRSWLRVALVHRLQKFWSRQRREPRASGRSDILARLQQLEDPTSGLTQEWNRQHQQHVTRQLLDRVRSRFEPQTWEAFRRTAIGGESPAGVGKDLHLSPNAVCAAKYRVLQCLRREGWGMLD